MADATVEAGEVTDAGVREGDAAGAPWEAWEEAPAAGGIMAGVFASFSEHGFDLGYRRAVSDAIALLLLAAAEHRREAGADPQARAAVSEFVDRLDRHLQRLSPTVVEEVYGGLGI
jgi:hypothetical protein